MEFARTTPSDQDLVAQCPERSCSWLALTNGALALRGIGVRTLCGAASRASVAPHGNGLLVLLDILEVLDGLVQVPAVDGLCGLTSVLERDTQVGAARTGRLCRVNDSASVANLFQTLDRSFE